MYVERHVRTNSYSGETKTLSDTILLSSYSIPHLIAIFALLSQFIAV